MELPVLDTLGSVNATTQAPTDGRSTRWAQHRQQRRTEMLDVARRLIHSQGPDVTMEDIAAASGTSKSIVYRYFTDKAQLQRLLGQHILGAMHERLRAEVAALEEGTGHSAGTDQRVRAMIGAYVSTVQHSPNVYRFVTSPSDGLNSFLDNVSRLVATFLPETVPSPELWAHGAVGFVERSVEEWMNQQSDPEAAPVGPDDLADHLVSWLMKGLNP